MLEVNDRRQAEDALRKSEEKYRELVELSNSIIIRRDISGKLTFINEYAQKFFGYTADEIIGRNIVGTLVPFHDKDGRDLQQMIHDIGANPELYVRNENENMRKDGSAVWIVWSNRGIMDENGNCAEILGVGTDITERRLAEIQIRKLLAEKELILQEVHHRIKNNMNTISVLLHLQSQSASIKDGAAAAVLQDARSRVLSMMLIYDKLYDSRDFRNISTRSYFPDLINGISSTFPNYERVAIKTRIDELVMDSNILAPAGIIINELLTNAFKYAFTYMEQGKIEISFLKRGDRSFEIIFCDNGCGMPESVVPGKYSCAADGRDI
jgi:PAS domain S-box-containing protein